MSNWQPKLSATRSGPLHRRLADAICADIMAGKLVPGQRLPPQRQLAHALSISVGVVTRAYEEAARHGLVTARVGRGTFVIDPAYAEAAQDLPIDLSINTAPIAPMDVVVETIAALRRTASWAERLTYQPTVGLDVDRRAAAAWLARTTGLGKLDWRSLICCSGAQNAMAIAFSALAKPGDKILCEAATFPGMKALAAHQAYSLYGVDMDGEGAEPQALDRAAVSTGARVLYLLPTLQNPTARIMSARRRANIVKVARARNLWIVEDDVYALYASRLGLEPIAALAPERTLYVSSLSKILSPGLRSGFLVAPSEVFDSCVRAARALMHSPGGMGSGIATVWIESGRADQIANELCAEVKARTASALAALAGAAEEPTSGMSLHLWLPMQELDAERAATRALAAGIRLNPPQTFQVSGRRMASGLRLCVGAAINRATLARAVAIVSDVLKGEANDAASASL